MEELLSQMPDEVIRAKKNSNTMTPLLVSPLGLNALGLLQNLTLCVSRLSVRPSLGQK